MLLITVCLAVVSFLGPVDSFSCQLRQGVTAQSVVPRRSIKSHSQMMLPIVDVSNTKNSVLFAETTSATEDTAKDIIVKSTPPSTPLTISPLILFHYLNLL